VQNFVNESPKFLRNVTEPKWHAEELKEAKEC
jgi:hypothetical protein